MNFAQVNADYFVLAVLVVAVIVAWIVVYIHNRRIASTRMRQRFGPEYERAVQQHGSVRRAEAQLEERERRVGRLDIRELSPRERDRFINQWNSLQLRFVDSPKGAVAEADDLIIQVMQTRGYPMSDFEQRAADISVDHPIVVDNYRSAHAIADRLRHGEASTEDLRKAMIHYRALFDEMVLATPFGGQREAA